MLQTAQLLKHLQGLMQNPRQELNEISRAYYPGGFTIISRFYTVFMILIPVSFGIKELIRYKTIKIFLFNSMILPITAILSFIVVLYLLSIILEETAQVMKGQVPHLAGAKVAYFSGLPMIAMLVFSTIPYIGFIFPLAGFIYQVILIYLSSELFFQLAPRKRYLWLIAVVLSFVLLLLLFSLLASLASLALNFIQL